MNPITKFQNLVNSLDAATLNIPLIEIENNLNSLDKTLKDNNLDKNSVRLLDQLIDSGVVNSRVVYFDVDRWKTISSLDIIGEQIHNYPLGIATNVDSGKATIHLFGLVNSISSSFVEDLSITVGVPYYLSLNDPGKITAVQPTVGIFIGVFTSPSSFVLNIQVNTQSHIHRRILLNPSSWVDVYPDHLLYPASELSQLPLPFSSAVIVFDEKLFPTTGRYTVDSDGIKLTDLTFFGDYLSVPDTDVFSEITDSEFKIELFYADPRTINLPGVMSLQSKTSNIILENVISGSENNTGSLYIKNIPVVDSSTIITQASNLVVKNIEVNSTTGVLTLQRGSYVERIRAGNNITVSSEQGTVTVNASASKTVEVEIPNVFLQNSISRLVPNTLLNNIGFPHDRVTGAIFKKTLPFNIDPSKNIDIFVHYFGDSTVENSVSVPFNFRFSLTKIASDLPTSSVVNLEVQKSFTVVSKSIASISGHKGSDTLCIQLERQTGSGYAFTVGIINLILRYDVL